MEPKLPEVANTVAEGRLEPMVPSPEIRSELESVLEADTSLLGEVWRRLRAGETAEQIQLARGATMPNFVWTYRRLIDALLEGDLPTAPTVALGVARKFRSLLRSTSFSPKTEELLRANLAIVELSAANERAREIEDKEAKKSTEHAEAQAIPGIYVYSLPHYLRHPYDEEANRTLFKVGHSNRSAIERFRQQTRTTALPEDPILLRVYPTVDADALPKEQMFHGLLEAADHDRSTARTGGTEWFLTSLRFLDQIATTVGLEVRRVGELEAPDL